MPRALTRSEKAALLKRLRLERGLGQRRLARASRLDVKTIAAFEHERQGMGLRSARRLAAALGVDVSVLLFAEEVVDDGRGEVGDDPGGLRGG